MKDKKITRMLKISLPLAVVFGAALPLYERFAQTLLISLDLVLLALATITILHAISVIVVFFYTKHENKPEVREKHTVNTRYARTEKVFSPYRVYNVAMLVLGAIITVASLMMLFCEQEVISFFGFLLLVFGIPSVLLLLLLCWGAKKLKV